MSYNHYDSIHNDPEYPDQNIGGCNCGPKPPQPPYYSYYPSYPNYLNYLNYPNYPNGNHSGYKYPQPSQYPNENPGGYNYDPSPPQPPQYPDEDSGDSNYGSMPHPPSLFPDENPGGGNWGSMPPQPSLFPDENPGGGNWGSMPPQPSLFPDENPSSYNDGSMPPQPSLFSDENPGGCNCGPKPHPPHPPFPPFPPFPFCDKRDEKDPPHKCPHKHHKNDGMVCCPAPRNCVHQEICQRFCINDFAKLCKVEIKGTAIHNCDSKICLSYKIFVEYLDCCGRHKTFCRSAMIQFCRPLKCGPHEYYRINIKNPPKVSVCGKQLTVRTSVEICCQR